MALRGYATSRVSVREFYQSRVLVRIFKSSMWARGFRDSLVGLRLFKESRL